MISSVAKSLTTSFGIASLLSFVLAGMGSDYVYVFLKQNIVSLQIGLLAINTATLGIVLTKLRDLIEGGVPLSTFTKVKQEMLLSIKEQMALIISALSILSFESAKTPQFVIPGPLLQILLITCFVYSLSILYDTAKSVFIVLDGD